MKTALKLGFAVILLQVLPLLFDGLADGPWGSAESIEPLVGNPTALQTAYQRYTRRAEAVSSQSLHISLSEPRRLSARANGPKGTATLDLANGALDLAVSDLGADAEVLAVDVWIVDRRASVSDEAASGPADHRIHLSQLDVVDGNAALHTVLPNARTDFELDVIELTRKSDDHVLLSGSPSLFQRLYYGEQSGQPVSSDVVGPAPDSGWLSAYSILLPKVASANTGGADLSMLVAEGERLFFGETFGGNGRTCGTCHPAANNFTIDPTFIATLPNDDPLFVAEFDPALAELESPQLLRQFGLIRTNLDGFEDPANKFVMRSVPHILGMSLTTETGATTAPFEAVGWSGDGAPGGGSLRDFTNGAVTQHFPKTLARVPGQDFRVPTEHELDAMEAFMLSLGRQNEFDLASLRLTNADAELGRTLFITEDSVNQTVPAAKCGLCHRNGGGLAVSGVNRTFDTGVENMLHPADAIGELRPIDGGFGTQLDPATSAFGDGRFNVTSLWEAADTGPYFHHNGAETLEDAISFYDSVEFKDSPEGQFILAFDTGGQELAVETDQLAAFLRVLNTLENIRSAGDYMTRAHQSTSRNGKNKLLDLAFAEIEDAIEVLEQGELHPEAVNALLDAAASTMEAKAATYSTGGCAQVGLIAANGIIDGAVLEAVVAREMMIDAPLVQLSTPIPSPELEPEPEPEPDPAVDPPPSPVCSIYGCTQQQPPVPPEPGTTPDPTTPPGGNSPEGEAVGIVAGRNLSSMHVMISTPQGDVTLQITSATVFKGNVALNLAQVVTGHEVEATFFLATNEVVSIETNFPAGSF